MSASARSIGSCVPDEAKGRMRPFKERLEGVNAQTQEHERNIDRYADE